jgi:hypothetical protein
VKLPPLYWEKRLISKGRKAKVALLGLFVPAYWMTEFFLALMTTFHVECNFYLLV